VAQVKNAGLPATSVRPRLWVVSELYYPEETSTGYFVTHIAESLASSYDVHALCSQPTYSSRGVLAPREEVHGGVFLLRLLNLVTISWSIFFTALRRFRRGDLVLVVTNPPLLPFVIVLASRLRRARSVLLIHDVYPEVLVATGMAGPHSPLVRLVSAASRKLYRTADRIVVLGRDMRALVERKLGTGNGGPPIVTIPNWGDVDQIRPLPRAGNPLLQRIGADRKFVVQFMGNMGRTHGIDTLLEAALRLRDRPEIHFLFVGWGRRKAWLEARVAAEKLTNVTVLPACPREELAVYLSACDVAAIAFRPGMAGVSVPSRMYNVMAAGKPILAVADPESELAAVVREERVGWIVPPGDVDQLCDTIRAAAAAGGEREAMGRRARVAAEARYVLRGIGERYRALFDSLKASA
jgi:colanic acid biosynthesis glycosyl transferase WcaI